MHLLWCILLLSVQYGAAVIYHLNESEYLRMPPVFGLDEFGRCLAPGGTYCLLRVDLVGPQNDLMNLIQEYSEQRLKHYNHTYLERGVCVTSTCKDYVHNYTIYTEEGLEKILGACLNDSIYKEYGLEGKLTKIYYCERKNQEEEIETMDWVALGIFAAVVLVNVIGTVYDVIIRRSDAAIKGNKYILSFSLIQNWNKLVSAEPEEVRRRSLSGLHGIRVLTIFLMFASHIIWVNSLGFNDNIQDFEEMYESPYYQMVFNGLVVIQAFFVMSGFLLVYNLETHAEKHAVSWGMGLKVWIMRWWRLTPAYAMVLLFTATWQRLAGAGPLWRQVVTDASTADCRAYWWAHLLYVNNYIDDGHHCLLQTWYIACDTQLFCLGLIVYLLTRQCGGRRAVLAALVVAGVVLPAAHTWAWDLDAIVLMTPEFYRTMVNDTFHFLHVYGHNNVASYAIGMAAGHLVYHMQKNRVDISNNKLYIFFCWLILPLMAAIFYSGAVFYPDGARAALAWRVLYAALQRPVAALIITLGVVALAMKLNTPLRKFFEWPIWLVPSRLTYSVYLIHMTLITILMGSKHTMGHASTYYMTLMHFGVVLMTFMVALPFSLLVEAPVMRLIKALCMGELPRDREQTKV